MSGPGISLGLGARKLKDKDFFGKSDPYVIISKPSTSGGFTVLRTSDTRQVRKWKIDIGFLFVIQNTLNPDWDDFFFMESELDGIDKELNLK